LAGAFTVILLTKLLIELFGRPRALLLSLILAADSGGATWAVSGMETQGFTLAVLATAAALERTSAAKGFLFRLPILGALAGLLPFLRPEGVFLGFLFVGLHVLHPLALGGRPRARHWANVFLFAVLVGALILWRAQAYGDWLPGPVRAKWTPCSEAALKGLKDIGLFGIRRFPLALGAGLAIAQTGPAVFGPSKASRDMAHVHGAYFALSLAGVSLALVAEVVLAGGDWMGRDRLPASALPLLVILGGMSWHGLERRRWPAILIVALGLGSAMLTWVDRDRIPPHGHAARRLGEWLGRSLPRETRLGVAAAGAIPFYSGLYAIDALGVTDPLSARKPPPAGAPWKPGHMRYDLQRFLDADPDVIVWEFGSVWSLARLKEPPGDFTNRKGDYRRELLLSPVFRERYRPFSGVPAESERFFTAYTRIGR
jgi:hypothetical protein